MRLQGNWCLGVNGVLFCDITIDFGCVIAPCWREVFWSFSVHQLLATCVKYYPFILDLHVVIPRAG